MFDVNNAPPPPTPDPKKKKMSRKRAQSFCTSGWSLTSAPPGGRRAAIIRVLIGRHVSRDIPPDTPFKTWLADRGAFYPLYPPLSQADGYREMGNLVGAKKSNGLRRV